MYKFEDFCCCPNCFGDLKEENSKLTCLDCSRQYDIEDGIALLMPEYKEDKTGESYHDNYEAMAKNFFDKNKDKSDHVAYRHHQLLMFIGSQKNNKVLDIGSSHGLYLNQIKAKFKVAFDIALTYLKEMPKSPNTMRVQGDAEHLPFKQDFFDTIILADILEHLLNPKNTAKQIKQICNKETRVIIHIPWKETLESYVHAKWEFSHLRSFNEYKFAAVWNQFVIVRTKTTYPNLRQPLIFRFENILPKFIYNWLTHRYFHKTDIAKKDAKWRNKMLEGLPKNEWWLLLLFDPIFKMYEIRPYIPRTSFVHAIRTVIGKIYRKFFPKKIVEKQAS